MKLVTNSINETAEGKLTVWRTDGPLDDMIFELSANLTADGERLIVVDATGHFDPSRVSRAAGSVPRSVHVLRATPGEELHVGLWATLQSAQQRTQARRVLLVGILDHLYDRGILTRDAARALGRMKLVFEALRRSGLEVTVVCRTEGMEHGARTYLVSSLCASAQEVHHWPLASHGRRLRRHRIAIDCAFTCRVKASFETETN